MLEDLCCKRGIDKVHQIKQQFGHLDPYLPMKVLSVYGTALYGSSLWQLNSSDYSKLCRSWNTAVKIIWNLPLNTHMRFLENLSPVAHLESVLAGRYIGFLKSLSTTSNKVLGLIYKQCTDNVNTQTGLNKRYLMEKHSVSTFSDLVKMKTEIKYKRINMLDEDEIWKIDVIKDIVLSRKGLLCMDALDNDEMEDLLKFVCSS